MSTERNLRNQVAATLVFYGCIFIFLLSGGVTGLKAQGSQDVAAMAEQACQGVGVVREASRGTKGAPILILEENHASRAGQIEQSIAMVRLYDRQRLRDIALEGYKAGDIEISTGWFQKATTGLSFNAKADVAVRLLKEGEISCAEFMKMVYDDMKLHRTEKREEYGVELGQDASVAPFIYLLKIAQKSLKKGDVPKINKLTGEFKELEKQGKKELVEKKRQEIIEYILAVDPWVKSRMDMFRDTKNFTSEQQLALAKEIEAKAASLSITMQPDEKQAMKSYIAFFAGRSKASDTMIAATEKIADQPNIPLVALVSGAAHTEGMCKTLKGNGRPFAVIRPKTYDSDIPWERFKNKYDKRSLYSKGVLAETILKAMPPPGHKKPEYVLGEPWAQAKTILYANIIKIAKKIPQSGGGQPPFGFGPDDLRIGGFFIDPQRISLVNDPQGPRMVFPVVIGPAGPSQQTLWVKAALGFSLVDRDEHETIEDKLRSALTEVGEEGKLPETLEDISGILQIGPSTKAVFASSQSLIMGAHIPN